MMTRSEVTWCYCSRLSKNVIVTMATHSVFVIECCEETVIRFPITATYGSTCPCWRRKFGSAHACLRNLVAVSGYQQRTSRLTLAGRNFAYVRLNVRFVQSVRSERFSIAAGVGGSTRVVLRCDVLRCVVTTTSDLSRDGRRP